jgi:O-antigen/teichoic acid export membrane protein
MATRSKRFASGVVTCYGAIFVNVFYTLLSVRLALHYLGKEQFGLWALALQVFGY